MRLKWSGSEGGLVPWIEEAREPRQSCPTTNVDLNGSAIPWADVCRGYIPSSASSLEFAD